MFRRSLTRLTSLVALLPLLVLAVSGFGESHVRCLFTGQISDAAVSPCCPSPHAAGDEAARDEAARNEGTSGRPIIREASCCAREGFEIAHPPAEPAGARSHAFASDLALPGVVAPCLPPLPPSPPASTIAHPSAEWAAFPPTPILLLKQSLLV